jgi:hypothetical protein
MFSSLLTRYNVRIVPCLKKFSFLEITHHQKKKRYAVEPSDLQSDSTARAGFGDKDHGLHGLYLMLLD